MKKLRTLLGGVLFLLLLCSCKNGEETTQIQTEPIPAEISTETLQTKTTMPEIPTETIAEAEVPEGTAVWKLSRWQLYQGSVEVAAEELDVVEVPGLENGVATIYGGEYLQYEVPRDRLDTSYYSGWRINLEELTPAGITENGYILLIPECGEPPLFCLYEPESDKTLCYFRRDIQEQGVAALELEVFDVYPSWSDASTEEMQAIWDIHTVEGNYSKARLLLDGDWSFYSMTLVHRTCPALQYEINIEVCNGMLFIENIACGYHIEIPIA